MGFDYVNHKMNCPICQNEIDEFQTKDLSGFFDKVEFWECDNFYSSCRYCNTWIDFKLKKREKIPIHNYEMSMQLNEVPEYRIIRNSAGKIIGFKGAGSSYYNNEKQEEEI